MRWLKIPPQIVRLLLVTFVIVSCYLILRQILTPVSFGAFGWYRAQALEEISARTPVFAGRQECDQCHAEILQTQAKFAHKTLGCETCHWVGQPHVEDPDVKTAKLTDHTCLRCHEQQAGRPAWFKQITSKKHYAEDRCTECHDGHKPDEK